MNYNKAVSIIVPVYNASNTLDRCLYSILRQTETSMEVIIVDDGSSDQSIDIINRYKYMDSRIMIIRNDYNHGVSYARNIGIDNANGEYIVFIDADDYVDSSYVESLIAPFKECDYDLVICGYYRINNNKIDPVLLSKSQINCLSGEFHKDVLVLNKHVNAPWGKAYRRSLIEKFKCRFSEDIMTGEDQLFNFTYYKHMKQYYFVNKAVYYYNKGLGISHLATTKSFESDCYVLSQKKKLLVDYDYNVYKVLISDSICYIISKYVKTDDTLSKYLKRVNKIEPNKRSFFLSTPQKSIIMAMYKSHVIWMFYLYKKVIYRNVSKGWRV